MSENKVILITGASSGIGFDAARTLAEKGYRVFGTCRKPEEGGYGFTMVPLDVDSTESVQACLETVIDEAGRIDVLINNAGFGLRGALEEATLEEVRAIFETNVFGLLRMCQAVLPVMRSQGDGLIINVSSISGLVGIPFGGIYNASKFAVEGLSQVLRLEVAQFGIKVAVVNPGFTVTKFAHNARYSTAMPEYASLWEAGQKRIEDGLGSGPDPDIVTEAIIEIIEEDAPEANYIIGEDSAALLDDWNSMKPEEFMMKMLKTYRLQKR